MKPTTIEEIECMLEEIPDDAAFNSDIEDFSDDDEFDALHNATEKFDALHNATEEEFDALHNATEEFEPLQNASSFVDFDIENMEIVCVDELDTNKEICSTDIWLPTTSKDSEDSEKNVNNIDILDIDLQNVSKNSKNQKAKQIKKKIYSSTTKTLSSNTDSADESHSFNPVWKRKFNVSTSRPEYNLPTGANENSFSKCNTPTDVFLVFMDCILEDIVYQTNLYGTQNGKNLNIKNENMLAFIGINFIMGYNRLPSWKDYWSTSPDLGVKLIAESMPRALFDKILVNLHCNDNTALPDNNKDKLYKIRPMIDKMNFVFKQHYFGTREVSVDESMIKFKGRSSLKQYNPMKPIKRGYKLWCLADQKGYVMNFKVYQGREELLNPSFEKYGLGERVVLELTEHLWNQNREVYFDNYFSSTLLIQKLKVENTLACGTLRVNRKGLPSEMTSDKTLNRGKHDSKYLSDGTAFFKWKDSKPVHIISNFHGSETTTVTRKEKNGISHPVPCPTAVADYNRFMGGVDLADRLRALYNVERKSRKWWHRIFFGLIDILFVNSYIVYCDLFEKISVLQFRRAVAQGLLTNKQIKKNQSPQTPKNMKRRKNAFSMPRDVRTSNTGVHWPKFTEKRARCEVCSSKGVESRPFSVCNHCKVHLCVNEKKNCFAEYHEMN